jgi:hypothetical protein
MRGQKEKKLPNFIALLHVVAKEFIEILEIRQTIKRLCDRNRYR